MNGTTGHQIKATEFNNVEVTGDYDKSGFRVVVEAFAPYSGESDTRKRIGNIGESQFLREHLTTKKKRELG